MNTDASSHDPATDPSREEQESAQDRAPQSLEGLHILVVDDEVDARDLFAMVLRSTRAHVSVAGNVDEALAAFVDDRPDLLVSDIGMPGQDGYSLIRRVRLLSAEAGGDIPAIALTAFTGPEHRARALEAGFTMHVPKPVDPDRLIEVVTQLALGR
jgi:CheY-like chemotaxis protein